MEAAAVAKGLAPNQVMLEGVRISFIGALFAAKQVQGQGEAKFSAGAIFPPNHPCVAAIKKAMEHVAKEKWKDKAAEVYTALKAQDRLALHDGDSKPQYDGYKGNLFVNASNKVKPLVLNAAANGILQESDGVIYSGCYVNMKVEVWAQDNKFGKRINLTLLGVQDTGRKDGARLSGGGVASFDDFQAIPEAAGAAPAAGTEGGAAQTPSASVFD